MNDVVRCPKCGAEVPLTESLAAPMVAAVRAEMQARIDEAKRAAETAQEDARKKSESVAQTIADKVVELRRELGVEIAKQERSEWEGRFIAQGDDIARMQKKLADAQAGQAAAVRRERELADKERELDLTIEQRVTEAGAALRAQAERDAAEGYKLQLMQSEQAARELREQIEDLKRKALNTDNRLQGEVQELDLEATLRAAFPFDVVAEVAKGVNGADCSQLVRSHTGQDCGTILYESKRTKNWSPGWLPKLREDARRAKAHLAVLVTQAMPAGLEGFDQVDGVWVAQPKFAAPLAAALRECLLRAHAAGQAAEGMKTKAEEVYAYMTGRQFRGRVEAIVEAFAAMREDLEAEKRATLRVWAKREAQIGRTMESTAGMFGDLQGISGKALPEIAGLALPGGGE